MIKGMVVSHIVSTKKQDSLVGSKFMEVRVLENDVPTDKYLVAVDSVGAGIGEVVLVTLGSSARLALTDTNSPVDAVIVGIVD
ncbi:MAG: EutN/CcmL family microcompartment protein [Clostridia bacterium]|nr:EutN/CcmL family microcompartment protein [Clostridia bacterium]